jgi:catechol 2,3-dioxygenase-like lactoylglutathione lyase family enzyme
MNTHQTLAALRQIPPPLLRNDILRVDQVSVRVPDLAQGVAWYSTILGLVEIERRHGRVYLGGPVSGRYAVALTEGGTGMEYVSFAVNGPDALQRLGALIDQQDVTTTDSSNDARTGTLSAFRLKLPAGHVMELAVHQANGGDPQPRRPAAPGAFNLDVSHVQLRTGDVSDSANFLSKIGFYVTDYVKMRDREGFFAIFTRINEYHHQIALFAGNTGFHHVALETDQASDVMKLGDHLLLHRVAAEYGPGRHVPGQGVFMYIRDPWGNRVEISSPITMVGFDAPPRELTDPIPFIVNMWGPQPPESWRNEVT